NVKHEELLQFFRAVLDSLSTGELRLGAKTQRGLGEGQVDNWSIHPLRMDNPDHLEAWLSQNWSAVPAVTRDNLSKVRLKDLRRRFTINASFRIRTSILMRSPGDSVGAPDMIHHTEGGTSLITGTGVAGAFLNRVEKIANTMLPDARNTLPELFRPQEEPNKD